MWIKNGSPGLHPDKFRQLLWLVWKKFNPNNKWANMFCPKIIFIYFYACATLKNHLFFFNRSGLNRPDRFRVLYQFYPKIVFMYCYTCFFNRPGPNRPNGFFCHQFYPKTVLYAQLTQKPSDFLKSSWSSLFRTFFSKINSSALFYARWTEKPWFLKSTRSRRSST